MSAKHTPGPWICSSSHSDTCDFEVREDAENGDVIAGEYGIPNLQDARLIAAAPDLLAALERIYLETNESSIANIARAAADKARGES